MFIIYEMVQHDVGERGTREPTDLRPLRSTQALLYFLKLGSISSLFANLQIHIRLEKKRNSFIFGIIAFKQLIANISMHTTDSVGSVWFSGMRDSHG